MESESARKYVKPYVAVVLVVLLVVAAAAYASRPVTQPTNGTQQKIAETVRLALGEMITKDITLGLQINVTDHGKLVSMHYFPQDLIMNNFHDWLISLINNAQSGSAIITSGIKNTAGASITPCTWGITAAPCAAVTGTCLSANANVMSCTAAGQGGLIEVGTVSTAATRADTNLGAAFQSYFDTSSQCITSTTDSVVVSGSENANSGTTITESGLFLQYTIGASTTTTIMMAHDVFGGIVVAGGNTITVQYTLSLNNAGFNYNLCEYLAAFFTQPNGAGNQVKTPNSLMVFFDTQGRNVTWSVATGTGMGAGTFGSMAPLASSSPTTSATVVWSPGDTNNAMQIQVGTGTAAFTPTTRTLTAFTAQNFITSTTYDSAGNSYYTANIVIAGGATISEAGVFLTLPKGCIGYSPLKTAGAGACVTSYGSDTIMLMAATFTGQAVPAGQSIGITFQIAA